MENRTRKVGLVALIAALVACLTLAGPAAAAKKKKKGGGAVDITNAANAPIPDRPAGTDTFFGRLDSAITVGRQFRGTQVRDVNVTVQTAGTSGNEPALHLVAILKAPNGAHTTLFANLIPPLASIPMFTFAPFPSIGPLTLDDESRIALGFFEPHNPNELYAPYAGTARPGGKQLAVMDGGPAQGTWTLTVLDNINLQTSNLASWRLNVVAGKPFRIK